MKIKVRARVNQNRVWQLDRNERSTGIRSTWRPPVVVMEYFIVNGRNIGTAFLGTHILVNVS